MVGIITSGFGFTKTLVQAEPSTPIDNLIKDLENKLPNLPAHEQGAMAARIAAMKTAAKTNAVKDDAANVGIEVAKFAVGKVGGPVGSAIATYAFHGTQQEIKNRKSMKIQKAEMVGGRRISRKCKSGKPQETSAVAAAAKAGITSVVVAATGVTGMITGTLGWAYSAGKSLMFG
ncbi:hypothetical protein [Estrella lausannensis]|uniref:Putative membrane protein n=1 Tax=Estrella lausannensis TaxID=483423 RepID=A0A0H5DPG6_9BACT|nr:hypothetical protein [Estrella lausannensis]CRX38332.1 putative membrane protein [Estrella lausannensis]